MSYQVRVAGPAQRYLLRLPRPAQARILARVDQIAKDPYDPHAKGLTTAGGLRSARVGGWRIIFAIDEEVRVSTSSTSDPVARCTESSDLPAS